MKTQARVVVVGGGVVGCSVLYHLVKKGWSDVVLCERAEIGSGATSHAVGHVILYTLSETVSRLVQHSVDLYSRLKEETGQDPAFHRCGNLRLATNADRLDEFKRYLSVAESVGVHAHLLTPAEVKSLWPLLETRGLLGAIYNPDDGHLGGSDLARALAAGARQGGAELYRNTKAVGFGQQPNGEWIVQTERGRITCEHVVSCTGNYAYETLRLVGLEAHSVPVRHQYLVTESLPELVQRRDAGQPEMPVMRDPEASYYVRQEGMGLAFGCYEGRGEATFVHGVPPEFGPEGLPPDLDKMMPVLEKAVNRIPKLGTAGIKAVTHSPMPYTPDHMPTTGPAFGVRNFWLGEGNPFGITLAGGVGWQLAEWIVEGEPSFDMWPCDPRRFGRFATRRYSARKVEEAYEHSYQVPRPDQQLAAARPLKTTPLHDLLAEHGAVFEEVHGWERPNRFTAEGVRLVAAPPFYRPDYFERIGHQCRATRKGAGLTDSSHSARFAVTGPGAEAMLDRVLCTRLPEPGDVATSYALSATGTVRSEFTVAREGESRFLLDSAPAAERYDLDLLQKARPPDGSVRVDNLTGREGALAIFGPKAARLIAHLTEFTESQVAEIASASATAGFAPARLVLSPLGGEDGWQLKMRTEFLRQVFLELMEVGTSLGLRLVGTQAINALRLEAGVPTWGAELTRSFTPLEAGLGHLVAFDKGEFRGRDALLRQRDAGVDQRLVLLQVSGNEAFDPIGQESVCASDGRRVGRTTSGGFGHCSGKSLAMAYISSAATDTSTESPVGDLQVKLMDQWFPARILPDPPRKRRLLRPSRAAGPTRQS